jgi:methylmalonyl-CoA/ethylmalonyl-CoA epimerase
VLKCFALARPVEAALNAAEMIGEGYFCELTMKSGEIDMKVNKIDHLCIAVKDLEAAKKIWEPMLGKSGPDDTYIDEAEKIHVARYMLGEVGFELMESTSPDGEVAKFIEKNGEGFMLISFNVDNTREAVEELQDKDYPFIPAPNGGIERPFRDCEFAFIYPNKMNGVLTELIDYKWEEVKK